MVERMNEWMNEWVYTAHKLCMCCNELDGHLFSFLLLLYSFEYQAIVLSFSAASNWTFTSRYLCSEWKMKQARSFPSNAICKFCGKVSLFSLLLSSFNLISLYPQSWAKCVPMEKNYFLWGILMTSLAYQPTHTYT
jgi:hypothetical protein